MGEDRRSTPPDPVAIGDILAGRYRVQRVTPAGRGTLLVDARDVERDRPAAVCILRAGVAAPERLRRFVDHARAIAAVHSEHAAAVLHVGETADGSPFVAMEELVGDDLAQVLEERGPLDPEEAVDLALQALDGLAAAHAVGVLHREISPVSLLLVRAGGKAVLKVLEFRGAQGPAGASAYAAPEQLRDPDAQDPRSDVWSVGAVLYELLSGERPFTGASPEALRDAILAAEPRELGSIRWEVPSGLAAVVMRCLHRDPALRYPDVDELAVALAPHGSGAQARCVSQAQAALSKPSMRAAAEASGSSEPSLAEAPPAEPALWSSTPAWPPHAEEGDGGSISAQIVAPAVSAPGSRTFSGVGESAAMPTLPLVAPAPLEGTSPHKGGGVGKVVAAALLVAALGPAAVVGSISMRGVHGSGAAAAADPAATVTASTPPSSARAATVPADSVSVPGAPPASESESANPPATSGSAASPPASSPAAAGRPGRSPSHKRQILERRL